jgi:hypothetical protein
VVCGNKISSTYFALNAAACSLTELLPLLVRETENHVNISHTQASPISQQPSSHQPMRSLLYLHWQSVERTTARSSSPAQQHVKTTDSMSLPISHLRLVQLGRLLLQLVLDAGNLAFCKLGLGLQV